jgi:hypothetical protein
LPPAIVTKAAVCIRPSQGGERTASSCWFLVGWMAKLAKARTDKTRNIKAGARLVRREGSVAGLFIIGCPIIPIALKQHKAKYIQILRSDELSEIPTAQAVGRLSNA